MFNRFSTWFMLLPKKKMVAVVSIFLLFCSFSIYFLYQKFSADQYIDTRLNISARVFDGNTNLALSDVRVTLSSQNYTGLSKSPDPIEIISDSMGTVNITLPDETTYDLIRLEKDGYSAMEGTFSLASQTTAPKEVSIVIGLKPGRGQENVHFQTIMPSWNLISSPLIPEDPNPATFFTYNSIVTSDGVDNLKKEYINPDSILQRWDNETQGNLIYDTWTSDSFGEIKANDGYWLDYKGSNPVTVIMKGKAGNSLTDSTKNIAKAGWSMIGLPTTKQIRLSEIGIGIGDNILTINQAIESGDIGAIFYWDNETQGLSSYDIWASEGILAKVGDGYWLETRKDNVKIYMGQTFAGHLQDINGSPLSDVQISLTGDSTNIYNPSELVTTDANGNYSISGLNPSYKWINIYKEGYTKIEALLNSTGDSTQYVFGLNFLLEPGSGTKYAQIIPMKKGEKTNFGLSVVPSNTINVSTIIKDGENYRSGPLKDQISSFELEKQDFVPIEQDKFTNTNGDQLMQELTGSTATTTIDQSTYIFGGTDKATSKPTDNIYSYDSSIQTSQQLEIKLPKPLTGAGSFSLPDDNTAIIIGGTTTDNEKSNSVYALSIENNTINSIGTIPPHKRYQTIKVDDNIILLGEDDYLTTIYSQSIGTLKEQLKTNNCLAENATCALNLGSDQLFSTNKIGIGTLPYLQKGMLYFFGGVKNGSPVNTAYSMPATPVPSNDSSLTELSQTLPYTIAYPSALPFPDQSKLYLMGGKSDSNNTTDKVTSVLFSESNNLDIKQIEYKLPYACGDFAYTTDKLNNLHIFSSSAFTDPEITFNDDGTITEGDVPEPRYNQTISSSASLKPGQVYSITPSDDYALVIISPVSTPQNPIDFEAASIPSQAFVLSNPGREYFLTSSSLRAEPLKHFKVTFESEEYNLKQAAEQNLIEPIVKIGNKEINLRDLPTQDMGKNFIQPGSVLSFTDKADVIITRDYDNLEPAYATGYMLIDPLVKALEEEVGLNIIQVNDLILALNSCTPSFFDRRSGEAEREDCLNSIEMPYSFNTMNLSEPVSIEETKDVTNKNNLVEGADARGAITRSSIGEIILSVATKCENTYKFFTDPDPNTETATQHFVRTYREKQKSRKGNIQSHLNKYYNTHEKRLAKWYKYYYDIQSLSFVNEYNKRYKNNKIAKYDNPFFYKRYWTDSFAQYYQDPGNAWKTSDKLDNLYYYFWGDLIHLRYEGEFTDEERRRLKVIYDTIDSYGLVMSRLPSGGEVKDDPLSLIDAVMTIASLGGSKAATLPAERIIKKSVVSNAEKIALNKSLSLAEKSTAPKVIVAAKAGLDLAKRNEINRNVSAIATAARHNDGRMVIEGIDDLLDMAQIPRGSIGFAKDVDALPQGMPLFYYNHYLRTKKLAFQTLTDIAVNDTDLMRLMVRLNGGDQKLAASSMVNSFDTLKLFKSWDHPDCLAYVQNGRLFFTSNHLEESVVRSCSIHELKHLNQFGPELITIVPDSNGKLLTLSFLEEFTASKSESLTFKQIYNTTSPIEPISSYKPLIPTGDAIVDAFARHRRMIGQPIPEGKEFWEFMYEYQLKGYPEIDRIFSEEAEKILSLGGESLGQKSFLNHVGEWSWISKYGSIQKKLDAEEALEVYFPKLIDQMYR